jgi:hypothetical protein
MRWQGYVEAAGPRRPAGLTVIIILHTGHFVSSNLDVLSKKFSYAKRGRAGSEAQGRPKACTEGTEAPNCLSKLSNLLSIDSRHHE